MKGRIIKIENNKFYLITETGEFMSADAVKGFECGDEVEIKKEMPAYTKPLASMAAAVLIMIGGVYAYHIPVRYVDVCINPEIQLSLNVLDRVIAVEGKNTDGEKIISSNELSDELKNESIDDAIDDIVDTARSFGYMQNDDNSERDVIVSVYGNNAEKLSKKIPLNNVRVVDESECEKAEKANISVGKYVLIKELEKVDVNKETNTASMSVKQIIDKIDEIKSRPKATSSPTPVPTASASPTATPTLSPQPAQSATATVQPTKSPSVSAVSRASSKKTTASRSVSTAKKSTKSSTKPSIFSSNKLSVSASNKFTLTTPTPTSKPNIVQVSATSSPTKAPEKVPTAIPSFNDVKRPSPNQSGSNSEQLVPDKNKVNQPKNENKNYTQPSKPESREEPKNEEIKREEQIPSVPNQSAPSGGGDARADNPSVSQPKDDKGVTDFKNNSSNSADNAVKPNNANSPKSEIYSVPPSDNKVQNPPSGNRQPSAPAQNTGGGNPQPTQPNPNRQPSGEKAPQQPSGGNPPSAPHRGVENGGRNWR